MRHADSLTRAAIATGLIVVSQVLASAPLVGQEPAPIQAGVAPPPGPYAPGVNVVHYDVEVGLGLGTDWFEGITDIRVAVTRRDPSLPLDFTGLAIRSVQLEGAATAYTHDEGVLTVPLEGHRDGDTISVRVHYEGVPDDGLILGDNVHGVPTAFVDNWPNRARFWFPSVDHPADKATVDFTVHAPTEWKVIANGHLIADPSPTPASAIGPEGDRHTWRWEVGVPISPYNMVIGAADLDVTTIGLAACGQAPASRRDDGCVEVTTWIYPEDRDNAEPSFRRSAEMVDYFTDLIGPYPFEKLANVQSATRFGGMENASAIFYSEQAIAAGADIEGTVSHEIAHQWFGDAVTEASWHHLWLSEGFASYFGDQFFEVADGVEDFRARMERSRQRIINSAASNRPIVDPAEQDLFALLNTNNYPKGAWVLHMLRGLIGDEAFFAGIRDYYASHLHTAVLTDDFRAAMERASNRSLEWFFRQWIYLPGFPTLEYDVAYIPDPPGDDGYTELTIRQVQPAEWPTFRLRLEVELMVNGEPVREEIEISQVETVVRLQTVGPEPTSVVLDPDGWVLKGDR